MLSLFAIFVESTCKFLKEICWSVQRKIDFQHSKFTTILRPATLNKILTSASNISSLFFASNFAYLSDGDIEQITRLTKLQHLKLPNINSLQTFTNLMNYFVVLQSLTLSNQTTKEQLITISQLTGLKSLSLAFIKEIPESCFCHLTTLQQLTRLVLIGFKQLRDATVRHISVFTNLIYLNLAFGDFSEVGLASVALLTKLQNLNLRYCDLMEKSALTAIVALTCLTRLELSDCRRLNEESLRCISHCTRLVALSFGNWFSTLTNSGLNWIIDSWSNLKKLNLVGVSAITDLSFSRLCLLSNLVSLRVGQNKNTTAHWITSLTTLKHITRLECVNMPQLTDNHFAAIAKLTTLRNLSLIDVTVTEEGFKEATRLIDLHYLTLMRCTRLSTTAHLTPLSRLTTLRVLHLIDMSIDDSIITVLWPLTCIAHLSISSSKLISLSVQNEIRHRLRRGVAIFKKYDDYESQ
jgi:F-box/leucine-rich repeat protein 14